MSKPDYSIQPESTTTAQARTFQFNTRQIGGMNETAGVEGFGHEESQIFGNNTTTPAESMTDLRYGQTLYKKGQNLGFGNKDGNGAGAVQNPNGGNKAELWTMGPEAQLNFFQTYQLNVRDLFTMEQIVSHPDLKMKKYKQSIYYGIILNGKRHGFGVMVYQNERAYEGCWENDLKHGRGYEFFQSGSSYDGYYINGKPEGRGTYLYANGEIYEGEWINGMKHGSGIWRGNKGDSYIGEWKFGKADGYGVHTWLNGDRYEGQFKQCLKHGEGTEKFANGDSYIGNYQNGKPEGYGEYYWVNGSFFKGFFKNGLRHGKGVWKRGPGNTDIYEGEYFNDKKCGTGVFTWSSGNFYKGNYFDDLRHGYGEMFWTDNSYYKGLWERGIQHGEGEMCMKGEVPRKGLFENNQYMGPLDNDGFGAGQSPQRHVGSSLDRSTKGHAFRNSQHALHSQTGRSGRQSSIHGGNNAKGLDNSYNHPVGGINSGNNTPKYSLPSISRNHKHARSSSIQSQGNTLGYSTEYYDSSSNNNNKGMNSSNNRKIRPNSTLNEKGTTRLSMNDRHGSTVTSGRGRGNSGGSMNHASNNLLMAQTRSRVQQKSIGRVAGAQSSRSISPKYRPIEIIRQPKKIWRSPGIAGLKGRVSPL